MSDINLTRIFIQTDGDEHRQQARRARTISEAFASDGRLKASALTASLPWQRLDWFLPGTIGFGTNAGAEYDMPQGGVIRLLRLRAKTPPSTGPCTITVTTGADSENVSIPQGQPLAASPTSLVVNSGEVVRINVASAADAADVTVTAFYSAGES